MKSNTHIFNSTYLKSFPNNRVTGSDLKQLVLVLEQTDDYLKIIKSRQSLAYKYHYGLIDRTTYDTLYHFNRSLSSDIDEMFPLADKTALRMLDSMYHRKQRLYNRIEKMFSSYDDCVFLTLTFTDYYLKHTNETFDSDPRRLAIRRFLKRFDCYVGNVDFGDDNGREHYHAIVNRRVTDEEADFYRRNYGNINFEMIHKVDVSSERLSKYMTKLCNHALKASTRRSALLYSRLPS